MSNASRDDQAAVPAFSPGVRSQILKLLTPQQRAGAIQWNQDIHPSGSGLELQEIQTALDNYVDWGAIRKALEAQSKGGSGALYSDAELVVEAIHQFQQRCFIDPGESDGKAGEHTLDSLGLTQHRLPGSVDIPNHTAQGILSAMNNDIQKETQGEFSATNWFDNMVSPSFLGRTVKNGIHVVLARKLRRAERYLLSLPAYQGVPPVALGSALGIKEELKGARPKDGGKSMHLFGLAVDINYTGNPWVAGSVDAAHGSNEVFTAVMRRASLLISGEAEDFDAKYLWALYPKPTTQIYRAIASKSQDLQKYFELAKNKAKIRDLLAQPHLPDGIIEPGESMDHGVDRWCQIISQDLADLQKEGSSFHGHSSPAEGFLNLHEDLVTSLRDHSKLAWGAVDFGPRQSGDMMHFDDRREGVGLLIRKF
jgi:hypothetical protein